MASRLTAALAAIIAVASVACGSSPTEPAMARTGSLAFVITQPCPVAGTVTVVLDGRELGAILVSGETSFMVPAGSHALSFRRGADEFAAAGSAGQVVIVSGGSLTLTDPLGVCVPANH